MFPNTIRALFASALIVIASQSWMASADIFTAISDVEYLLETHKRIIDDLDVYLEKEENRLNVLKSTLRLYKSEHETAMKDIPNYLGNPINAFTLIKRLTFDLDNIEENIKMGTDYIKNITMSHPDLKYPTKEDLVGAAQALTRLQETYQLEPRELAEGRLNGVEYSAPMSVGDCYELARALYNQKDYRNALAWMTETLRKFRAGEHDADLHFDEIDIVEHIAYAHYLLGDARSALAWTHTLLALSPTHQRALGNVPHYTKIIADEEEARQKQRRGETGDSPAAPEEPAKPATDYSVERKFYEKLCRGEMELPAEIAMRLKCRYLTENHPFLRLAPIKTEQLYIQPDIYMFHNVISDEEIQLVKNMAQPRFKRAVVHHPVTGELVPAQYRISKSGWLKDEEHPAIARITQRVSDMTGLSMSSAEELQVVNYGIGGHYEPHFDFARKRESAFRNFPGNRIATVLFYMSEVAQGGATVFTELGLAVAPVKNAAAYWLNLLPSGEGDLSTRHAACPVLRGSKWVCNKWLHEGGQELIRPCGTVYQEEGFIRKTPKPVPKTSR